MLKIRYNNELLERHRAEWGIPLAAIKCNTEWCGSNVDYNRGFPTKAWITASDLLKPGALEELVTIAPASCLYITKLGTDHVKKIAKLPELQQVRYLNLATNPIGGEGVEALAQSPHAANLLKLSLFGCRLENRGAIALANSPCLHQLTELQLGDNAIGS